MDERDLWAAVIAQAVEDMNAPAATKDTTASRIVEKNRRNARAWLRNTKGHSVGSFPWICESLGYSPGAIQAKVL